MKNNKRTNNEKNHTQGRNDYSRKNQDKRQNNAKRNSESNIRKYSDDEIARAKHLHSKAVFLVRDHVKNENIDTAGKWIDISNINVIDRWDRNGNYVPEILSFDAELFDKTEIPIYDESMTEEEKHNLTYEVAQGDINKQKRNDRESSERIVRPSYHLDVSSVKNKERKTEYKVKNIKRKK